MADSAAIKEPCVLCLKLLLHYHLCNSSVAVWCLYRDIYPHLDAAQRLNVFRPQKVQLGAKYKTLVCVMYEHSLSRHCVMA